MFNKLISIIVPVYNEEENIPLIYERLIKVLAGLRDRYDYEIIWVNDGSTDKSGRIIEWLASRNQKVKYLEFSRNFGKEIAITAGLDYAKGEAAIMTDADLQHPPELIPQFLEKWEKGAEVVIGLRQKQQKQGLIRRLGTFLFYRAMKFIGETEVNLQASDFRLIDRKVIQEFNRLTERSRITRGLIDWLGFSKDYIYFKVPERESGQSGHSLSKLTKFCLSGFVSHSLFPLKLAGYLGIVITLFAGFLGLFIFVEKYVLSDPLSLAFSGPAMLAVFILFLIGIVLVCLGLITLYIADIHTEILNRPMYVIRKKINLSGQND